jgi:hypothetical protein
MQTPIALTDSEMSILFDAARPLQPDARDGFLKEVAKHLAAMPERGDGAVYQVCREVQRDFFDSPFHAVGPAERKYAATR